MIRQQNFEPKTKALEHQIEAIHYIAGSQTVALFDEQGLGKSKIIIDAMAQSMKAGEIEGVLVVAPMSLLYIWEAEVGKHSFLIPVVLKGSKREKKYRFLTGANFYITNYEAVVAEYERFKRFCKSRKVAIVLDESARIKDPSTKTAQALFELANFSVKRVIATGTPVANKPQDLWAQYFFLDNGQLLGDDFSDFKSRTNEKHTGYMEELERIKELIKANSIRRRKNDVLELPERVFKNIYVDLASEQKNIYDTCSQELLVEISNLDGQVIIDQIDNVLKKLLRLTQIASNPWLLDKSYEETPGKFKQLDSLVEGTLLNHEKLIVWSCFVDNIKALANRYKTFKPLVIYGQVSVEDRALIVSKFQDSDKNRMLIANPAAAREGFTLTRASTAIYLDRNFSLVDYLQSQDRIYRIGQTKPCAIYKLLARNTLDEYIDLVIDLKSKIAGFLQSDKEGLEQETLDLLLNKKELLRALGG